jgi:hypothetical protein
MGDERDCETDTKPKPACPASLHSWPNIGTLGTRDPDAVLSVLVTSDTAKDRWNTKNTCMYMCR